MLTALFWLGWAALSSSWTKMYSSSIVLWRKCCEEVAWRVCWCAIFYNSRSINFLLYCRRIHLVITTKNKSKNNYVNQCFSFQSKKKIYRLDFFFLFRPRQKKKVDVFKRESWMGLTSMEMVAQSGARAHSVFAFDFFWKQLFLRAQAQTSWQEEEDRVAIWPFFKTARQIWNDTTICPIFGLLWIGLKKMFLFIALFWKYLSKTYTFLKKISKMFSYFIKFLQIRPFSIIEDLAFLKQLMGKFGLLNMDLATLEEENKRARFSLTSHAPRFTSCDILNLSSLKDWNRTDFLCFEHENERSNVDVEAVRKSSFVCATHRTTSQENQRRKRVCVCVKDRERETECMCEREKEEKEIVYVYVCVLEREREMVCAYSCMRARVCVREREKGHLIPTTRKTLFFLLLFYLLHF